MKVLVAIVVAVVQLVGSQLCCCGLAQWTNWAPSESRPIAVECPLCKALSEDTSPAESIPEAPKCPSCSFEFVSIPAEIKLPVGSEPIVLVPWSFELAQFKFARVDSPCMAAIPGLRIGPWLTPRDRLYTHHVLRC